MASNSEPRTADDSANDMVDTGPKSEPSPKKGANRHFKRWHKALVCAVAVFLALFLYLQTDLFHGRSGDLSRFVANGDDWSIHTSQPQDLFQQPKAAQILNCLLNQGPWAKLLGFPSPSPNSFESLQEIAETWTGGEILLTVKWPKTRKNVPKSMGEISAHRPFDSMTLILRPTKGRAKALARLIMLPGLTDPILGAFVDPNAGAERFGDIIQMANPGVFSGEKSSEDSKIRGLAFTTIKDLIIIGTSYDDVLEKRKLVQSDESLPAPPEPGTLMATLSSVGQEKLQDTWTDLFGARTTSLIRSLGLGPQNQVKLQIAIQFTNSIHMTTSWDGTAGQEDKLDNLESISNQAVFSGNVPGICRRIGEDFSQNFDGNTVVRHASHFLGPEGEPLPTIETWLNKETVQEVARQLDKAKARNLRLSWAPPATTKQEDSPWLCLSLQVEDKDCWAQISRTMGIPTSKSRGWQELKIPPTLGFTHYTLPHVNLVKNRIHLANGPPNSAEQGLMVGEEKSLALWRFHTTGAELSGLLQSLDAIRLKQLAHPTFEKRQTVLTSLGNNSFTPAQVETRSNTIFRRHHQEAKDLLMTRGAAFQSLFEVMGDIRGEAHSQNGRTIVTVIVE